MLRLSNRRLRVYFHATHVQVVALSGVWKPVERTLADLPVDSVSAGLAALGAWLGANQARFGNVECILSAAFTRFMLLEWSEGITDLKEQDAIAAARFELHFGGAAEPWQLRIDQRRFGRNGICAGIERQFLEQINTVFKKNGWRLRALRPSLMFAFNQWRKSIQGNAILVVAEDGRCVLATLRNKEWESVRTMTAASNDIETAVAREKLLQGLSSDTPVYTYCRNPDQVLQKRSA